MIFGAQMFLVLVFTMVTCFEFWLIAEYEFDEKTEAGKQNLLGFSLVVSVGMLFWEVFRLHSMIGAI